MWSIISSHHMLVPVAAGLLACLLSLVLTPVCRDLSLRYGFVDRPDNYRKLHGSSVPRIGGTPLLLAYFISLGGLFVLVAPYNAIAGDLVSKNVFLLAAVATIFSVGLADDLKGLTPIQKLLGQIAASVLAVCNGLAIHLFHNPAIDHWTSPVITVVWLLLSTNAFNLIDGLDGLASGVGLFATITIAVAALKDQNGLLLLVTAPLAGALIGFLRYNFAPASVFLGDCGSLSIGFLLGCFGAMWSEKITTLAGLSAPLMAMSLPLAETGVTILRRTLRNKPIFGGDRDHIHHRLLDKGNSVRRTALLLYGVCVVGAVFSLLQQALNNQFGEVVFLGFLAALLVAVRQLHYTELSVLRRFFTDGNAGRLVKDQILLQSLQNQLRSTTSPAVAIELMRPVCSHFGFADIAMAPLPRGSFDTSAPARYEISIAIGDDHVLLLTGGRRSIGTFGLDQLLGTISHWFADHAAGASAHTSPTIDLRDSFVSSPQARLATLQENGR